MTVLSFVFYVLSGSTLGGVAYFFSVSKFESGSFRFEGNKTSGLGEICFHLTGRIILGAAAALGVYFLFFFLQVANFDDSVKTFAFTIATAVLCGFSAGKLLPKAALSLEQKVDELQRSFHKVEEEAQEANVLASVQSALRQEARDTDRVLAISMLRKAIKQSPLDRKLVIPLGRLLRMRDELVSAIEELTKFIEEKERNNQKDQDYADVLFNRACYFSIMYSKEKDSGQRAVFLERAIADLSESIRVAPSNKEDAKKDEHLLLLQDTDQFRKLVFS